MKKYIFLDIDGVLAIPTKGSGVWQLNDVRQRRLGRILEATNADIVLSSSWRYGDVETTRIKMEEEGFWFSNKIVGVTIRAYHYIQNGVHLSIPRGVEIKQWLDVNVRTPWIGDESKKEEFTTRNSDGSFKKMELNEHGVDYKYVIIDDDSDMLLEHKDLFVHTDSFKGLQQSDVEKAIEILK